jgi:hypothetical protein
MSTSVVPPPAGGNGKYIAVVVVLGALVAILLFKTCGGEKPVPVPPVASVAIVPSAGPVLRIDDIPLPVDVPDAAVEQVKHPTSTNNGMAGCDAKSCRGGTTPDLESALAFRAKQAHRCYDTALAQDNSLQGKVSISVRIAPNGNVCSAGVASNDMASAGVGQCVANMFRQSGHFPIPKGGCVDANVPISFVPGGR